MYGYLLYTKCIKLIAKFILYFKNTFYQISLIDIKCYYLYVFPFNKLVTIVNF